MKWVPIKVGVIAVCLLLFTGCAHRQYVKAGDEAMEQEEPYSALDSYRIALQQRPGSGRIERRIADAEEEILSDVLAAVTRHVANDEMDAAVGQVQRAVAVIADVERLDRLEAEMQPLIVAEAERRREAGNYRAARSLIEQHEGVFGAILEPVAQVDDKVRQDWAESLRQEAQAQLNDGRPGAAVTFSVMADAVEDFDRASDPSLEALRRVGELDSWGVVVEIDEAGPGGNSVADQIFAQALPEAITDAREGRTVGSELRLKIEIEEPSWRSWEEREARHQHYQTGTREVSNPAYERSREKLRGARRQREQAQRNVSYARHDVRRAQRELRRHRRQGHALRRAEHRLDRAYRHLDLRERQLRQRRREERQLEVQLRRLEPTVEEPTMGTHTFETIVQRAEMSVDITVALQGMPGEVEDVQEFEVTAALESRRHDSQPELNLSARNEPAPSREEARRKVDEAVAERAADLLEESFQAYRRHKLDDMGERSGEEQIDALGRYIVLDPWKRAPDWEAYLEQLVDFRRIGGLLVRLAREEELLP